jgi:hypothetical protein
VFGALSPLLPMLAYKGTFIYTSVAHAYDPSCFGGWH